MKDWRCWLGHRWRTHQHGVQSDSEYHEHGAVIFVIAWKQCERCAKSKLIHVLI